MSWCDCVIDSDYEVFSDFPYDIRRKSNKRYVSESLATHSYPRVVLNNKSINKHVLLMKQFKPLDESEHDEKVEIDHINRDKGDYHLSNLRFVTHSDNMQNSSGFGGNKCVYVDNISDEAIVVKDYGDREFNDLYFDDDVFYKFTGINYRKLHVNERKNGSLFVSTKDADGKRVRIFYSKFKRLYDLI
jgi:hypothetical protein